MRLPTRLNAETQQLAKLAKLHTGANKNNDSGRRTITKGLDLPFLSPTRTEARRIYPGGCHALLSSWRSDGSTRPQGRSYKKAPTIAKIAHKSRVMDQTQRVGMADVTCLTRLHLDHTRMVVTSGQSQLYRARKQRINHPFGSQKHSWEYFLYPTHCPQVHSPHVSHRALSTYGPNHCTPFSCSGRARSLAEYHSNGCLEAVCSSGPPNLFPTCKYQEASLDNS